MIRTLADLVVFNRKFIYMQITEQLEEKVYMKQPKGFSSSVGDHLVCKHNKTIYGLKQASRQWYLKFHKVITSFGFE